MKLMTQLNTKRTMKMFVVAALSVGSLAMTSLMAVSTDAQPVQVHIPDSDPTTGPCNVVPFGAVYYQDARYQVLVRRNQLPGPGSIVNLAFAPCLTTISKTIGATRMEVRIAHTPQLSLSGSFDDNLTIDTTTVFSGTKYDFVPNQWSDIAVGQFTTPFMYNGVDNVVIEVRYSSGSGGDDGFHRATGLDRAFSMGAGAFTDPTADYSDDAALKMRLKMVLQQGNQGAPATGDLILAGRVGLQPGVFSLSLSSMNVSPQYTFRDVPNWIEADRDNTAALTGFESKLGNEILRLGGLTAKVSTVCAISTSLAVGLQAMAPDFDLGSEWVAAVSSAGSPSALLRIDSAGNCTTLTILPFAEPANAVCVGPDGDYTVGLFGAQGRIIRVDRTGKILGDLLPQPMPGLQISSIAYSHRTDEYLVTQFGTPSVFAVSDKLRTVRPLVNTLAGANCIRETRGTPGAGSAWVASRTDLSEIDLATGRPVRVLNLANDVRSFYVDGDNLLTVQADDANPNRVRFVMSAGQRNANKVYILLLSGGTNGLPLPGGRFIDLTLDYLLFASLANPASVGLFKSNLPLDQNGNGVAELRLPVTGGKGRPIYASYVLIDPRAPGGIGTISETEVFLLR